MPDDDDKIGPKEDRNVVRLDDRRREKQAELSQKATAYFGDGSLGDETKIPARAFLYGKHYLRSSVSGTFGDGGTGKSSLHIAEAVAMASSRPILGLMPCERLRVFLWNAEEPIDEIRRRVHACCRIHGIDPTELEGWLFISSGLTAPFKIDNPEQRQLLRQYLLDRQIQVSLLDPLVRLHSADENDNAGIDRVAHLLSSFAAELEIAIDVAHHTRKPEKGSTAKATSHDARGASSLKDAFRSTRVLNQMTKDEAPGFSVQTDQAHRYVRVDAGDKANYGPRGGEWWMQIRSFTLDNGDDVGAIERWAPKGVLADVPMAAIEEIWRNIGEAEWRSNPRSQQWIGYLVAQHLDLDTERDRKRISLIIKTWLRTGVLVERERKDHARRPRMFLEQGPENPMLQS